MQKNTRAKKVIIIHSIILGAGLLYYILIQLTHFSIPCPIHTIIGLRCPGCGLTTMALALAELDFTAAFNANQFIFCVLPLLLIIDIYFCYKYIKYDNYELPEWVKYAAIILIILLFIFAVIRNLFGI